MKLHEIKQQMEYRDSLKWVQTKLKDIRDSNYTNIDLEITFTKGYPNNEYIGPSKCRTPLYFDKFEHELVQEWLEYNEKFFSAKLNSVNAKLNKIENLLN